jgi:hypothetical protein
MALMVFSSSVKSQPINGIEQPRSIYNDHEASRRKILDSKYFHLRWCPSGLTHSQKRKLQRLRAKELSAKEADEVRDEFFNEIRLMVPQKKEWRAKVAIHGNTGLADAASPAKPVSPAKLAISPPKPVEVEKSELAPISEGISLAADVSEEKLHEELVDYSSSPDRDGMNLDMINFSTDYEIIGEGEEEMAQFNFGHKSVVFSKPTEAVNHLKPLYVCGQINGKPISRMLVDGSAIVNLMPYSLYKKLGKLDSKLIKTNMTLNRVGGDSPIDAKESHPWS